MLDDDDRIEYVDSHKGYTKGQEVEYIHPDFPEGGWMCGRVVELDANEIGEQPFMVVGHAPYDHEVWVKADEIRPLNSTKPVQLQYRVKTTNMDHISPWRNATDASLSSMKWDYRDSSVKLEFFEIRVKPEFVPGYYQCVDDSGRYTKGEVVQFAHHGELDDTRAEWVRVNVTPAE